MQRLLSAMSDTMMRAPRATPSRLELRGTLALPIPERLGNAPTPVGQAPITEATMLPWLPDPCRIESQSLPLSRTAMIEWIFRCAGPNGCVPSVTRVAVWAKLGVSALIPLSSTPTICGGTAAVPLLYFCSAQTPPGNGPVQVPVPAPVQQAVGLPAATHWELLVQSLFVAQVLTGLCVHSSAPLPPPSRPASSNGLAWFDNWSVPTWTAGTFLALRVIFSRLSWRYRTSLTRASLPRAL